MTAYSKNSLVHIKQYSFFCASIFSETQPCMSCLGCVLSVGTVRASLSQCPCEGGSGLQPSAPRVGRQLSTAPTLPSSSLLNLLLSSSSTEDSLVKAGNSKCKSKNENLALLNTMGVLPLTLNLAF